MKSYVISDHFDDIETIPDFFYFISGHSEDLPEAEGESTGSPLSSLSHTFR
jgi:hypothetical protein